MVNDRHGEVMNLVTAVDSSMTEVVQTVLRICASSLEPEYRPDTRAVRSAGGTHLGFSRDRAKAVMGWEPQCNLEQGIRRYIAWLESAQAT